MSKGLCLSNEPPMAHASQVHIWDCGSMTMDAYCPDCGECIAQDVYCHDWPSDEWLAENLSVDGVPESELEGVMTAEEFLGGYEPDLVNHPPHYKYGAHEVWDVIHAWGLGYCLGNVVKYVARADRKGHAVEDLKKARAYLDREIKLRGG